MRDNGIITAHTLSNSPVIIDCPKGIKGSWDKFRIELVILNLLTNALKYSEGGPVHIQATKKASSVLIHAIDKGHRGKLSIKSSPAKGSTFTLELHTL
jgi:signal transduction histidine kinase